MTPAYTIRLYRAALKRERRTMRQLAMTAWLTGRAVGFSKSQKLEEFMRPFSEDAAGPRKPNDWRIVKAGMSRLIAEQQAEAARRQARRRSKGG